MMTADDEARYRILCALCDLLELLDKEPIDRLTRGIVRAGLELMASTARRLVTEELLAELDRPSGSALP